MCRAFSCLVTREGEALWKRGIDSHDELFFVFKLKEDNAFLPKVCRVEVTPKYTVTVDCDLEEDYLHPSDDWELSVDEDTVPVWWNDTHVEPVRAAFRQWRHEVYSRINLEEARKPIHPFRQPPPIVGQEELALLRTWASVVARTWASVGDSAWASVGDSVRDSVGDSVWSSVRDSVWSSVGDPVRTPAWAYLYSLFTVDSQPPIHEALLACAALWRKGLVPSFDGNTWRLHGGEKAAVVWEGLQRHHHNAAP